jgi:hypothetical protein
MAGISNLCAPLHIFGEELPVWYTEERKYWVESRTLSQLLGYVQVGSLRKQVLHDWDDEFVELEDYYLERDGARIRDWEAGTQHVLSSKPVKPARGLLFFSGSGIKKVLLKSSKERASRLLHLLETNELEYFRQPVLEAAERPQEKPELEPPESTSEQLELDLEAPEELEGQLQELEDQEAQRFFRYEVLQRLLEQLQELEMPSLQELAIEAAEIALDRELSDLRRDFGLTHTMSSSTSELQEEDMSSSSAQQLDDVVDIDIPDEEVIQMLEQEVPAAPPLPRAQIDEPLKFPGPIFTSRGYYSLSKIGHMAGGYSAKTAGVAADVVAKKLYGFSHDDIRTKQLPFNQLVVRPDRRGSPRKMFRFNRQFANQVLHELRTNSSFQPETPKGEPTIEPRNLSVGPFDDKPPRGPTNLLE